MTKTHKYIGFFTLSTTAGYLAEGEETGDNMVDLLDLLTKRVKAAVEEHTQSESEEHISRINFAIEKQNYLKV